MFTFGDKYGFIRGALQTLGFRVELVRPQSWQRALGLGTGSGLEPRDLEEQTQSKVQQLYPSCKVTLKTADALLLLEYAKRGTQI